MPLPKCKATMELISTPTTSTTWKSRSTLTALAWWGSTTTGDDGVNTASTGMTVAATSLCDTTMEDTTTTTTTSTTDTCNYQGRLVSTPSPSSAEPTSRLEHNSFTKETKESPRHSIIAECLGFFYSTLQPAIFGGNEGIKSRLETVSVSYYAPAVSSSKSSICSMMSR